MVPKLTNVVTKEVFLSKLFESRDATHLMHLKTKSFAEHIALGDYYDGVLDLLDGLIESIQGKYGILNLTINATKPEDCCKYFKDLAAFLELNGEKLFKETWIQNQIDTIVELVYKTIYKLENLK